MSAQRPSRPPKRNSSDPQGARRMGSSARRGSGGSDRRGSGPSDRRGKGSSGANRAAPRPFEGEIVDQPGWGGVARRGAARVDPARGRRSGIQPPKPLYDKEGEPLAAPKGEAVVAEPEEWILDGVETQAVRAVRRAKKADRAPQASKGSRSDKAKVDDSRSERTIPKKGRKGNFDGAVSPQRAQRLSQRLDDAARAFRRERYGEVVSLLAPMAREAPSVVEVRELLGLSYYRLGRWKEALRELTVFATKTGSTEQHPVLADCARALGRYDEVRTYWDELCAVSPGADLMAEGRIVMAGSLADQGRLNDAISLMRKGTKTVKNPQERHFRMAYVLADLQERAGDLPAARSGFLWLDTHAPDFADVPDRIASLR